VTTPNPSDSGDDIYEVFALRYAGVQRRRIDNFIGMDVHDGPMAMDFYVWLLRSATRTILVDTGFTAETARARKRVLDRYRCPIDALRTLDVDPDTVTDVVLTHLHFDHAGNLAKLPAARFHLQDAEMSYATGRCMCFAPMRHAYSVEDVAELLRKVYAERVVFHDGDDVLAPGVELMLIGGHTRGLQSVRVRTARGWVVLASDASHYYENHEDGRPFPIVQDMEQMLAGQQRLLAKADSPRHVVPGHDPEVLRRYPAMNADPDTVCLHMAPID
jgi:glyoxylase-like metal-dependent hydrolase (beta-lactamase superfamily II)